MKKLTLLAIVFTSSYLPAFGQSDKQPGVTLVANAQAIVDVNPQQATDYSEERDSLVREVFAPITDQLNLSVDQKLQIAKVISISLLESQPLFAEMDRLEDELSEAAFSDFVDEEKIRGLASQQGQVMSQIIGIKARSKASLFQILKPAQRAMVIEHLVAQPSANLGALSN